MAGEEGDKLGGFGDELGDLSDVDKIVQPLDLACMLVAV